MERLGMALTVGNTTYLPKSFVTRKMKAVKMANKTLIMITLCLAVFSAISLFLLIGATAKMYGMKVQMGAMENELEAAKTELIMMKDQYLVLNDGYDELSDKAETLSKSVTSLMKVNEQLETQNKELAEQDDILRSAIGEYQEREELYDKYSYAILRSDGSRTDITFDQIKSAEDLAEENEIDVDLVLSMIMVESSGDEDAKSPISTARGYGQILEGTGKFIYEKLLDRGNYSHQNALDGDINLEMMITYLSYLDENTSSLYNTIMRYRGEGGSILKDYVGKIDQYLIKKNKSVLQLST